MNGRFAVQVSLYIDGWQVARRAEAAERDHVPAGVILIHGDGAGNDVQLNFVRIVVSIVSHDRVLGSRAG